MKLVESLTDGDELRKRETLMGVGQHDMDTKSRGFFLIMAQT